MRTKERRNLLSQAFSFAAIVATAVVLFPFAGRAAEEPKTNAVGSAAKTAVDATDTLRSLRNEADGADAAYAAYEKESGADQKEKLWNTYTQANDSLIPRIMDGVRQSPEAPEAFELLEWVLTNGRISARPLRPYGLRAIALLRDHYTAHADISRICRELGFFGDPLDQPAVDFLQIASTNNPDRAARGAATFALARLTKQKAEEMAYWDTVPPAINTNAATVKAKLLESTKGKDAGAVLHEAEQLFQSVKANYADVPNFASGPGLREPKPTLGEQATLELFDCEHLTVGKVAPEIEGEDLDGHKIKLSDYRGKVAVISFWATWCGPCMQIVPQEREIAQRLAAKPFVLLGVNGDFEKAAAKGAVAKENMTWRSFWNGGSAWGGIAETWNVHAWPTIYVIDSKGTVRLKLGGLGKRDGALLNALLDQLLEEAEHQGGAKT